MRKKPTAEISFEMLEELFQEFDIWAKIRDGRLSSIIIANKDTPAHHYADSVSRIVKHRLPGGRHIATTHRIEDPQGNILHEDAKDFHMQEICLWRF